MVFPSRKKAFYSLKNGASSHIFYQKLLCEKKMKLEK